jgi:hypothetical protein
VGFVLLGQNLIYMQDLRFRYLQITSYLMTEFCSLLEKRICSAALVCVPGDGEKNERGNTRWKTVHKTWLHQPLVGTTKHDKLEKEASRMAKSKCIPTCTTLRMHIVRAVVQVVSVTVKKKCYGKSSGY